MRSQIEINFIKKLKDEGKSFSQIAQIMQLTRNSVIHLYYYKKQTLKQKVGPKFKLTKFDKLRIKRQIAQYRNSHEKINSTKLKKSCYLQVSTRTVRRHLTHEGYEYRRAKFQILLSKKHKEKRVEMVTNWITSSHPWDRTVFTDEKRFSLDGPDNWMTYAQHCDHVIRCKRQCQGGGVMVWMMILPNYLVSFRIIEGKFRSQEYLKLLKEQILPIIMLNFGKNFFFQQDNAPVHNSKMVQNFLKESHVSTMQWPAKSPDMNIAEDVWKMISDIVYDGPQFKNKEELVIAITNAVCHINSHDRRKIESLYSGITSRLCKVLKSSGNLCNK